MTTVHRVLCALSVTIRITIANLPVWNEECALCLLALSNVEGQLVACNLWLIGGRMLNIDLVLFFWTKRQLSEYQVSDYKNQCNQDCSFHPIIIV